MALTSVVVSKKSVAKVMKGQWNVTWSLQGLDAAVELFQKDFNEDYKKGDEISRVEAGFTDQMQTYINRYKIEQQYLNAAAHDTAVSNVQAALEV